MNVTVVLLSPKTLYEKTVTFIRSVSPLGIDGHVASALRRHAQGTVTLKSCVLLEGRKTPSMPQLLMVVVVVVVDQGRIIKSSDGN